MFILKTIVIKEILISVEKMVKKIILPKWIAMYLKGSDMKNIIEHDDLWSLRSRNEVKYILMQ